MFYVCIAVYSVCACVYLDMRGDALRNLSVWMLWCVCLPVYACTLQMCVHVCTWVCGMMHFAI